jgi:tryptophan-rich sensory protein
MVLYVLMAASAWLVSSADDSARRPALVLWWIQLVVNAAWTWLFFGWHSGVWAFVDIAALFALVLGLVVMFWRIRPLAGAMLVPYLLWVGFATALTVAVWRLNPGVL